MTRARDVANIDGVLTTTGDTYYASAASTPARLGIGSTGQVMTVAGGVPSWATPAGGGGMTVIASGSLSGASVTLSSISGSYKDLYLILRDWYPSVNNRQTGIQFNGDTGSTYISMAGANLSEIRTLTNQAATNGNAFSSFYIYDYANASHYKSVVTVSNAENSTSEYQTNTQAAYWQNAAIITSITIKLNADNFSGGTYVLYGVN